MNAIGVGGSAPFGSFPSEVNYSAAIDQLAVRERVELAGLIGERIGGAESEALDLPAMTKVLLQDAEDRVRAALSSAIAANPAVPRDIVWALANDVDLVSIPVLENSPVLSTANLIQIIKASGNLNKMAAIAKRTTVPEALSAALVAAGDVNVVSTLLANVGAFIGESALSDIVEVHGRNDAIQNGLVCRQSLPPVIVARLIGLVSLELTDRLITQHRVPAEMAAELAMEARCRATIGLSNGLSARAMDVLIDELSDQEMLTGKLLVQSLCLGNFEFGCRGLAALTLTPPYYLMRRVAESPYISLPEYWRAAGLPEGLLPAACAAASTIVACEPDCYKSEPEEYTVTLIQRTMSQFDAMGIELEASDVDLLFAAYDKARHAGAARSMH